MASVFIFVRVQWGSTYLGEESLDLMTRSELINLNLMKNRENHFNVEHYDGPVYPLNMSDALSILRLKKEFTHSSFHQKVADQMYLEWPIWRKIRGDGNCCYRAIYI